MWEILCVPTHILRERMRHDEELREAVRVTTEAVFGTLYDRAIALYTKTPEERYNDLSWRSYSCIYNHRTTKTNQKYPSVNL